MRPLEHGIWVATLGAGGGVVGTSLYHGRFWTAASVLAVLGFQIYLYWRRWR